VSTPAGPAHRPAAKQAARPASVSRAPAGPSPQSVRKPEAAARPSQVPLTGPSDPASRRAGRLPASRSPALASPAWIQRCGTGSSCGCGQHDGPAVQALTVGPPGDRFEQEAERVANAVVHREWEPANETVTPLLQRQPAATQGPGEDEEEGPAGEVRARRGGTRAPPHLPSWFAGRLRNAQSGGDPLPAAVRAPMEAAFSASFGGVRIHADAGAAELSRAIGAAAFTHGSHIFLGAGRFDPNGRDGRRLLAHELTHVVQQNPQVARRGQVVARAPATALQRDEDKQGAGGAPLDQAKRQVLVYFFGDQNKSLGPIPYAKTMFAQLEPGIYDCTVSDHTITAGDQTERYRVHDVQPGGWRKLLGMTRRTVLVITDDTGKLDPGEKDEKDKKDKEPGTGVGSGQGSSGSKYGLLGLIHMPKWFSKALDKSIEALGLDEEIKEIQALLTALKDLYDHRTELGSLFTEEKLLGVLFGLEGGPGIEALGTWAGKRGRKISAGGGARKGLAAVTAKLQRLLEVVRKILRPIFAVRKAFTAVTQGLATILDQVPQLENLLTASDEERKAPDFGELLGDVVDDISDRVKASMEAARGHVSLMAEQLADQDYVTSEELARAIAVVAEKFLPATAKAVTGVASKIGVDIPGAIADHIIAPLIPKSALDEINGVIRGALSNLEPLIKAVTGAMDEILAGIEAELHDDLAPELKTLFAQLSPAGGAAGHGPVPDGLVESDLVASPGHPLPRQLRHQLAGELGVDFADVRVHADAHAARAASTLGARAFTIGRDVFFGSGRYAPAAPEGRRLLAHELTHVVQQAQGEPAGVIRRAPAETVKRKLGQQYTSTAVAAIRVLTKAPPEVVKRGKAITRYVEQKLLGHRVGSSPLPGDAYIYVRDKRQNPVNIRRRPRFVFVVPQLTIVKGKIERGLLSRLSPIARWQRSQRAKLRRALGCGAGEQAHHVIPLELWGPFGVGGHSVVAMAVNGGFAFNGAENGICLGEDVHEGSHPLYTARVERQLDALRRLPAADQLAGVRKVAAYQQRRLAMRQDRLD
jgi:hypothetical protein